MLINMNRKKNNPGGIVYSTDPDFSFAEEKQDMETLPPSGQLLTLKLDTKQRAGKVVTLVSGFIGKNEDLQALGKMLKTKCGTGGSAKDGIILIQGNYLDKLKQLLTLEGYGMKK